MHMSVSIWCNLTGQLSKSCDWRITWWQSKPCGFYIGVAKIPLACMTNMMSSINRVYFSPSIILILINTNNTIPTNSNKPFTTRSVINNKPTNQALNTYFNTFQVVSVWDWTSNGDTPLCSATLDGDFGMQVGFVLTLMTMMWSKYQVFTRKPLNKNQFLKFLLVKSFKGRLILKWV